MVPGMRVFAKVEQYNGFYNSFASNLVFCSRKSIGCLEVGLSTVISSQRRSFTFGLLPPYKLIKPIASKNLRFIPIFIATFVSMEDTGAKRANSKYINI